MNETELTEGINWEEVSDAEIDKAFENPYEILEDETGGRLIFANVRGVNLMRIEDKRND